MGINWNHLIYDAREEAQTLACQGDRYKQAAAEASSLEHEVKTLLPDDKRHLLTRLFDADTTMHAEYERALYLVGVQHGYELAKFLNHQTLTRAIQTENLTNTPSEISAEDVMFAMDEQINTCLQSDQAYTIASQRAMELFDAIKHDLPADKVKLLLELDNAFAEKEAEKTKIYYAVGLRHGNGLRRLLSPVATS